MLFDPRRRNVQFAGPGFSLCFFFFFFPQLSTPQLSYTDYYLKGLMRGISLAVAGNAPDDSRVCEEDLQSWCHVEWHTHAFNGLTSARSCINSLTCKMLRCFVLFVFLLWQRKSSNWAPLKITHKIPHVFIYEKHNQCLALWTFRDEDMSRFGERKWNKGTPGWRENGLRRQSLSHRDNRTEDY